MNSRADAVSNPTSRRASREGTRIALPAGIARLWCTRRVAEALAMRPSTITFGLVSLLIAVASPGDVRHAWAGDEPALTAEEEAAFYRWWDGLGYPDVTKLPFVKAAVAD